MDSLALQDGVGEPLGVERVVVELGDRRRVPQAKRAHVVGAVARDRHVVGDGAHVHVVELHNALLRAAADDEGVERLLPRVRVLALEAIVELLAEQPVAVEQAVAGQREILCGGRVQEAGGEAAQAAVAQRRVVFRLQHLGELEAVRFRGGFRLIDEPKVGQVIQQRPALEELRREVRGAAGALVGVAGFLPVVGELLDGGGGKSCPELLHRGVVRGASGKCANVAFDGLLECWCGGSHGPRAYRRTC